MSRRAQSIGHRGCLSGAVTISEGGDKNASTVESSATLRKGLTQERGAIRIFKEDARHDAFRCAKTEHPMSTNDGAACAMFASEAVDVYIVTCRSSFGYVVADEKSISEELGTASIHSRERFKKYA